MKPGTDFQSCWKELYGCDAPVAFITGSASDRVGRRIAEYFDSAGFRTVLHGHRSVQDDDRRSDDDQMVLAGDLQDADVVASWLPKIIQRFGRVDCVINSAAIWDPKPLEEVTPQDWDAYWKVNARGTALVCQHFGLHMVTQESGGCIINIGDWATRRPYRDFASYFPSKAAVRTITESMAVELATRNSRIRVNAILPGPVKLADNISDEQRLKIVNECLLRSEGSADDVASAAIFLASSPFVTGVCIPVDGGRSIYAGPSADPVAHPDAASAT